MNQYSETDAFYPQMLTDYRAWQKTLHGVDMVALRDELSTKLTNYPYCCKTYEYAPYTHIMLELQWTFVAYKVAQQDAARPTDVTLLSYQQRVVDERAALQAKIEKLRVFIAGPEFLTVYAAEQDRLQAQLAAMLDYSYTLGERIEAFQ